MEQLPVQSWARSSKSRIQVMLSGGEKPRTH
jgi:hypothetical protein